MAQSFTSLKADLLQYIKRCFVFSRHLSETFHIWVNVPNVLTEHSHHRNFPLRHLLTEESLFMY